MKGMKRMIALVIAGVLIGSQLLTAAASRDSAYDTVSGADKAGDISVSDGDASREDTVSEGDGISWTGSLAQFFSQLFGWDTRSAAREVAGVTGAKYSYIMKEEQLPEFLDYWKLAVQNKEGGYGREDEELPLALYFEMGVDDDYTASRLDEYMNEASDFPVPGSDEQAFAEAVDRWLTEYHSGEMEVMFPLPEEISYEGTQTKTGVVRADSTGEELGRYELQSIDGKTRLVLSLNATLYNRYGTVMGFSCELQVDREALGQGQKEEAKLEDGRIIFETVQSAGEGEDPDAARRKYNVEKKAPVRTDTPFIDYTITVEGKENSAQSGEPDNGTYLGGTTLVDTLPVLDGQPLAVHSLEYSYLDNMGSMQRVEVDAPSVEGGLLKLSFPVAEMEQIRKAEVSLTLALTDGQYAAVCKSEAGINHRFTNRAVMEDGDGQEVSFPGEAQTTMKWGFVNKTGEVDPVNGRYMHWNIDINTKFSHAGYAYAVDGINYDVHKYLVDELHPLRITKDGATTFYTEIRDITEELAGDTGVLTFGEYHRGDPGFAPARAFLETVRPDEDITPFYYRYQEGTEEKAVLIIPYKVIKTYGAPGTEEENYIDLTNGAVNIQYSTELNLSEYGGDVNQYLDATGKTEVNADNEVKFIYDKYYYGLHPGVDIDIEEVSIGKGIRLMPAYVEKSGISYDPATQKLRWKFYVNRYGAEVDDLLIRDEMKGQGMELIPGSLTYRRIDASGADSPAGGSMGSGETADAPYYRYENGVLRIFFPPIDRNTSYEVWLEAKLTDQTKLAAQDWVTIGNKAYVTGSRGEGTISESEPEGSVRSGNQWVEKKAVGSFDYENREFTWQVTVNPNFLTVYDAVLEDMLPFVTDKEGNKKYFRYGELKSIKKVSLVNGREEENTVFEGNSNASSITWEGNSLTITTNDMSHTVRFTFGEIIREKYILTFTTSMEKDTLKGWLKGRAASDQEKARNCVKLTGKVADSDGGSHTLIWSVEEGARVDYAKDCAENILKADLLDKKGEYDKDENAIHWTVVVNRHGIDMGGMTLVEDLTAAMAENELLSQEILEGSVRVYLGSRGPGGSIVSGGEITDALVRPPVMTVASADQPERGIYTGACTGFTLEIPAAGAEAYRDKPLVLNFDTVITRDGVAPKNLKNMVTLRDNAGWSQGSDKADGQEALEVDMKKYARTARRPLLQLYKCSVNSEMLALEGAEFELHEVTEAGGVYTVQGNIAKKGKTSQAGGVFFLNLKEDVVYQIRESKAPAGYREAEPQYVVFCRNKPASAYEGGIMVDGAAVQVVCIAWDAAAGCYRYPETAASRDSRILFRNATLESLSENNITFRKTQEDGVTALADAVFKLQRMKDEKPDEADGSWGTEGSEGDRYMESAASADGSVTFRNVDAGTYRLTETAAPGIWQKGGELVLKVNNSAGIYSYTLEKPASEQRLELEISDEPDGSKTYTVRNRYITGSLELTKRDTADGGTIPLKGAEYKVYTREAYEAYCLAHSGSDAGIGADASVQSVSSGTTDNAGRVKLSGLTYYQEYRIVEVKAPKGYVLETDKPVLVGKTDYEAASGRCEITPNTSFKLSIDDVQENKRRTGEISFVKQDGKGSPLSGRTFLLICRDEDLNSRANNGYFPLTPGSGGWQYGNAGDIAPGQAGPAGNVYYQLQQTGADGKITFTDVPYSGRAGAACYRIVELSADNSHALTAAVDDPYDCSAMMWDIDMTGNRYSVDPALPERFTCDGARTAGEAVANRLKTTSLTIVKRSGEVAGRDYFDREPIPGITFTLTGEDYEGKAVSMSGITDDDGIVTFTELPLPKSGAGYVLTESPNPALPGYDTDTEYKVSVGIGGEGKAVIQNIAALSFGMTGAVSRDADDESRFIITNQPYTGSISFTKKYTAGNAEELAGLREKTFAGVRFHLYAVRSDGTEIKAQSITSTEAGSVIFDNVVFGQRYVIKEEVPAGYYVTVNGNTHYGAPDNGGFAEVPVLTLAPGADGEQGWSYDAATGSFAYTDAPLINGIVMQSLELTKQDQGGNLLEGRVFSLYRRSESAIADDAAGMMIAVPENVGTYYPYGPKRSLTTDAYGVMGPAQLPYGEYLLAEEASQDVQDNKNVKVWISVTADGVVALLLEDNSLAAFEADHYTISAFPEAAAGSWSEISLTAADGVYRGSIVNHLKYGYVYLQKTGAELDEGGVKEPEERMALPGVEFTIYKALKTGEDYTYRETDRYITLRTDAEGRLPYAESPDSAQNGAYQGIDGSYKHLLLGDYVIRETKTLPGYALDPKAYGFTIDSHEAEAVIHNGVGTPDRPDAYFENRPTKVVIYKQDESGLPLEGAQFTLKPVGSASAFADGSVGERNFSTDAGGRICLEGILNGGHAYLLTETKAAPGYVTPEDGKNSVTFRMKADGSGVEALAAPGSEENSIHAGRNGVADTITITDCATSLVIRKVDDNGGRVAGAELAVYSVDRTGATPEEKITEYTRTTLETADWAVEKLPEGSYVLKEENRVKGYLSAQPIYFKVEAGNKVVQTDRDGAVTEDSASVTQPEGGDAVITMVDKRIDAKLTVTKKYAGTQETIPGLVFALHSENGTADVQVTDEKGEAVFEHLTEGVYTLEEDLAASEAGGLRDDVHVSGRNYKITVSASEDGTQVLLTDTTDPVRPASLNLPAITGSEPSCAQGAMTVYNERMDASLELFKYDYDNADHPGLADTVFRLEREGAEGSYEPYPAVQNGAAGNGEYATDGEGRLALSGLVKGDYRLTETQAAQGYQLDTQEPFTCWFEITNDDYDGVVVIDRPGADGGRNGLRTANDALLTEEGLGNLRKTGRVTIIKKGAEDALLQNVEFVLLREKEPGSWLEVITQLFTGKQYEYVNKGTGASLAQEGELVLTGLEWGRYRLKETAAAPGYQVGETYFDFTIGPDNGNYYFTYEKTLTNVQNEFTLRKTDSEGNLLKGAEFTLTGLENEENTHTLRLEEGTAVFTGLMTGDSAYVLRETKAPDGYELAEDVALTIDRQGQLYQEGRMLEGNVVTVVNRPIEASLRKLSQNDQYLLDQTQFILEDLDTGSSKLLHTEALPEGIGLSGLIQGHTYSLTETQARPGYLLPEDENDRRLVFTVGEDGSLAFDRAGAIYSLEGDAVIVARNQPVTAPVRKYSPVTLKPLPGCEFSVTGVFAPAPAPARGDTARSDMAQRNIAQKDMALGDTARGAIAPGSGDDDGTASRTEGAEETIWITDENPDVLEGRIIIGNTYVLKEEKAPAGYQIGDTVEFSVDESNVLTLGPSNNNEFFLDVAEDGTVYIRMHDEPCRIYIHKTDLLGNELYRMTGENIEEYGDFFTVTGVFNDGPEEAVKTLAEANQGVMLVDTPYLLREAKAPEGYEVSRMETAFKTDDRGNITVISVKEDNQPVLEAFRRPVSAEGREYLIYPNDSIEVTLRKAAAQGDRYLLEGAEFLITDITQDASGEPIRTVIPAEGKVLEGLTGGHTYTLEEVIAPEGYLLPGSEGILTFQVTLDGRVVFEENKLFGGAGTDTVTAYNDPIKLAVIKADLEGNVLEGAEFTLEGDFADGSLRQTLTPGKDGCELTALVKGGEDYVLTETNAPEGYRKLGAAVTLHVEEDGDMAIVSGNEDGLLDILREDGVSRLVIRNERLPEEDGTDDEIKDDEVEDDEITDDKTDGDGSEEQPSGDGGDSEEPPFGEGGDGPREEDFGSSSKDGSENAAMSGPLTGDKALILPGIGCLLIGAGIVLSTGGRKKKK